MSPPCPVQVVSGPLVDLVGGHRTMLVANVVAGLSTLATPWLVEQSLMGLVTCQVIAGWFLHKNASTGHFYM